MRGGKGFTLVEITIVVLIAGLLLGAIVGARTILAESQFTKLTKGIQGTIAAFKAYQERYAALPGDDSAAAVRFGAPVAPGTTGDDSGVIGATETAESDLERAGFMDAAEVIDVDNPPIRDGDEVIAYPLGLRGNVITDTPAARDYTYDGVSDVRVTLQFTTTQDLAERIDEEMDDDDITTGPIQFAGTTLYIVLE